MPATSDLCLDSPPNGIYIHIPYCAKICPFCSFNVVRNNAERHVEFTNSLYAEIDLFLESFNNPVEIDSVYFGGGTPSLMPAGILADILQKIRSGFKIKSDCTYSIEINPEDNDEKHLALIREAGFNRASIGVQSFDEAELKLLGRRHSPEDSFKAVSACRSLGFDSISLDLMYGIPFQTSQAAAKQAKIFASLYPEHISAYALTIESGTPFQKQKNYTAWIEANDGSIADSFQTVRSLLEAAGLNLYEVSNFAVDGHQSRQNLVYWNRGDYYGFGPGAHSKTQELRTVNTRSIKKWRNQISQGEKPIEQTELLTPRNILDETLMVRLRTVKGVIFKELELLTGLSASQIKSFRIYQRLMDAGFASPTADGFCLTTKGLLFADKVAVDFSCEASKASLNDLS